MKKNRVVPIWLSILMVLLCGSAFVLDCAAISSITDQTYVFLNYLFYAIGLIFAIGYCLFGYTKNVARYFFLTTLAFFLTEFSAALMCIELSDLSGGALSVIACACLAILLVAKDLGKKKSVVLSLIVALAFILNIVVYYVRWGVDGNIYTIILLNVSMAIVYNIMVFAKYKDKTARGTK